MRQKQPEPELLDDKKGFQAGEKKAYRKDDMVIVEYAGDVVKKRKVENPERDAIATLYNLVTA